MYVEENSRTLDEAEFNGEKDQKNSVFMDFHRDRNILFTALASTIGDGDLARGLFGAPLPLPLRRRYCPSRDLCR